MRYQNKARSAFAVVIALIIVGCENKDLQPHLNPSSNPNLASCSAAITQGYTNQTSYFPGEFVEVFLQSTLPLECGLGLYDVHGKLVLTSAASITQQTITTDKPWMYGFGFNISAKMLLPSNLASGIYSIENKIPIVVKSVVATDVTVVYPINTINAYNPMGGKSLYNFNSSNETASHIVSFLRPLSDDGEEERCIDCLKWFPFLQNISVGYVCDKDLDLYSSFADTKVLIILGHSEYWTRDARVNFDQFVNAGRNAIILSGNTMWWQARYANNYSQLICYRKAEEDPEPNALLKSVSWSDPVVQYPIIKSIGADFSHGGYGLKLDNGWDGLKIVNPNSPLLEGLNLSKGDIIKLPTDEYDGAPIKGFDSDGYPVLDNVYNFEKLELVGFDLGTRGNVETVPTFIVMKNSKTSGTVVNVGSSDWCSKKGIGDPTSSEKIKTITKNAIMKLLSGNSVFSN